MRIAYEVFHIEDSNDMRKFCRNQIVSVVGQSFDRLGSPTISIPSNESMEEFLANNPDFNLKANQRDDYFFPHKTGVIGVWASNFFAWKKMLEDDYDVLFLFEDDVVVTPSFCQVAMNYLGKLPAGWDFFSVFVPGDAHGRYNPEVNVGDTEVCLNYQDWSCAGYVVSKAGAQKALKDIIDNGIDTPIDWYVFNVIHQGKFNTYCLKPATRDIVSFFLETWSTSTIHLSEDSMLSK